MKETYSVLSIIAIFVAWTGPNSAITLPKPHGVFRTDLSPVAERMNYSMSPVYLNRLSIREKEIYTVLKACNATLPKPHPLITPFLADYEECQIKNKDNWAVWDHPFLTYRLIWRFAHLISPLIANWTQSQDKKKSKIANQLKETAEIGYPTETEDEMMERIVARIVNMQHNYDFPEEEMAVGKFADYETGVGLAPIQMFQIAVRLSDLKFFVAAKSWLDVLAKHYADKIDAEMLKTAQQELITSHDSLWKEESEGGEYYVYTHPISTHPDAMSFKHKEMQDWIEYAGYSGLQRERITKTLGLCSKNSLYEAERRSRAKYSAGKRIYLKCWLDTKRHAYFTICPLKVEQLVQNPDIFLFHDLFKDNAMESIEHMILPDFERQAAMAPKTIGSVTTFAWLTKEQLPPSINFVPKIEEAVGLNVTGNASDALRLTMYYTGGDALVHNDAYRAPNLNATTLFANRLATILIYFTDLAIGGGTVFPDLDLVVQPRRGSMIYWENYYSDGKVDWRTYHGSCPPVLGHKITGSMFIGIKDNLFTRPCGLFPSTGTR